MTQKSRARESLVRRNAQARVDAPIFTHSNEDRFVPGSGQDNWFKDIECGPEMVVIPAGRFTMGSTPDDIAALSQAYPNGTTGVYPDDTDWWETEGPQRTVTIDKPFAIGRHAVTRDQFSAFVRDTAYEVQPGAYVWMGDAFVRDPNATWKAPGFDQTDEHPVVCVSWNDARAFAAWLSSKTGKTYRLPTEAEREYVTRAGTATPFWWGASISTSDANYDGNHTFGGGALGAYRKATVPVETFAANPWGLYQVHGNVWEWCEDIWNDDYRGAPTDGSARNTARNESDAGRRVIRGGSWVLSPQLLRSANRLFNPAVERSHDLGFRLVRTLPH